MVDYVSVSKENCYLIAKKAMEIEKEAAYVKTLSKKEIKEELDELEDSLSGILNRHPVPARLFLGDWASVKIKDFQMKKYLLKNRLKRLSKKKIKAMVIAEKERKVNFTWIKNIIMKQIKKPKVWKSLAAGTISLILIGVLIAVYKRMGNKKAVAELEKANKKLELKR